MFKKLFLIIGLFPAVLVAAQQECAVKPNYNIVIKRDYVQLVNKNNDVIILPNGDVTLNQKTATVNNQSRKNAMQLQQTLRQQLPALERQSATLLSDVKHVFEQAIKTKLGNDNELNSNLNKLYRRLVTLLQRTIITQNGETYFYYQHFNNIKKEGEAIGKDIFYKIISDSILKFTLFKNYDAIKKIAKEEWKLQKPLLKAFDKKLCNAITDIDAHYQVILFNINQKK